MLSEQVAKLTSRDRFIYWIRERHQIYRKRRAGQIAPWTNDPVLRQYFFTNPYRENDKVTQWFRQHLREPLRDDPRVLFATVAFRWFNLPSTGCALMHYPSEGKWPGLLGKWRTGAATALLGGLKEQGKVFTGAFNISASGSTKPKVNRVCEDYIEPVWRDRANLLHRVEGCTTLQDAHALLRQYTGLGGSGFMAYEIICDLRYTYLLEDATDICTWTNPGPGCHRGLARLEGQSLQGARRVKVDEPLIKMRDLLAYTRRRLPSMQFEMREIEHSLCEYDKYERARLSEGHLKRKYHPSS